MFKSRFYSSDAKVTACPAISLDRLFSVPRSVKGMDDVERTLAEYASIPFVPNANIAFCISSEASPSFYIEFCGNCVFFGTKILDGSKGWLVNNELEHFMYTYREAWAISPLEILRDFEGQYELEQNLAKKSGHSADNHVVYRISYKDDTAPALYIGCSDSYITVATQITH